MLEAMVMDEVAAFFDDIDHFLSEARTAFMEPAEPTVPVEAPTPSGEIDKEADPAALLV